MPMLGYLFSVPLKLVSWLGEKQVGKVTREHAGFFVAVEK